MASWKTETHSQSAGFELLRRSWTGRCRQPWSPPCRARHEAAPEKGPGGSTFRASAGTGLLLNASLRRAWADGLLTVRRRCSLTGRSERQAERETCGPLKSARGGRRTRRAGRGARGAAGTDARSRGRHSARFPAALSSRSSSGSSGAGLFTGKSREPERTRRLTPKPTGTTWFRGAGSASRPALAPGRRARPDLLPEGPWWGGGAEPGARGILLTRQRLRDTAGGVGGRPPHTTAPQGQGWRGRGRPPHTTAPQG